MMKVRAFKDANEGVLESLTSVENEKCMGLRSPHNKACNDFEYMIGKIMLLKELLHELP
jgi:hypothetical protein